MHKALQNYNCNCNVQFCSNEVHLKLDTDCTVYLMLWISFCFEQILLSTRRWLRTSLKFPSEVLESFFRILFYYYYYYLKSEIQSSMLLCHGDKAKVAEKCLWLERKDFSALLVKEQLFLSIISWSNRPGV